MNVLYRKNTITVSVLSFNAHFFVITCIFGRVFLRYFVDYMVILQLFSSTGTTAVSF